MNEIKGQKTGEYFMVLNNSVLGSILNRGLLPRAKVREMIRNGEMPELDVTDACSYLTKREYIDEANEILDSYRPSGIAHPRCDAVFTFIYRGKLDELKNPKEGSRSTILVNGLTGEELVGDGCYVDKAVWYLIGAREGWPDRLYCFFAGRAGSEIPKRKPKLSEEEAMKVIEECAQRYWSTLMTLDEFIENYRAKGLTWKNMEYDNWERITDRSALPEKSGYPEIILPSKVEPSRLEVATKYIYKK